MPNPYDFPNVVAVKFLVKKDSQILLLREPETNDWMPGRLGLPGGKPLLNEKLSETIQRKIQTEIGFEIDVKGIVKIVDIIMPQKTVYHVLLAAEYVSGDINTKKIEADDMKWYTQKQISEFTKDDYTEYYNDEIISDYLNDKLEIVPMNLLIEQDNRSRDISDWMNTGNSKTSE